MTEQPPIAEPEKKRDPIDPHLLDLITTPLKLVPRTKNSHHIVQGYQLLATKVEPPKNLTIFCQKVF